MTEDVGDNFQRKTMYDRRGINGCMCDWASRPEPYKEYPKANKVLLPSPVPPGSVGLDEVLRRRRSIRDFKRKPIGLGQLAYLLWASTGIQRAEDGHEFRTAPSAGALYPIETYLVCNSVENVLKGIYHYSVKNHLLEELKTGDYREQITLAAMGQEMCAYASVVFVWTALFKRTTWKYKQRGYRYIYLDAGHVAANLALASVSLGLGSCQMGALFDQEVNDVIGVDGTDESVVYMSAVGHPHRRGAMGDVLP